MQTEIGSDFWQLDLKNEKNIFWWEATGYFYNYYKSGRNAIKALCKCLDRSNKTILLPVYTCESVIIPFIEENWKVFFYNIRLNLQIDMDSLLKMYNEVNPDVVLFQGYFGFDTTKASIDVLKNLSDCGCILVEDITSNFLSNNMTDFADFYISSFRKYFAIPDGGILVSRKEMPKLDVEEAFERVVEDALLAYAAKQAYFEKPSAEKKSEFKKLYKVFYNDVEVNDKLYHMNLMSKEILEKIDIRKIKTKRQNNYNYLLYELQKYHDITPVLGECTSGVTPLFIPIYYNGKRERLQAYLAYNGIYCPVIWPKPSQIIVEDDLTRSLYEKMLCIPIDQRYGVDEMKEIIRVLNEFV